MALKQSPFGQNIADELALIRGVLSGKSAGVVYGFHVDSTESNPSDAVTYIRDAVGMTPAKMSYENDKFYFYSWKDAFFLPRPCMLKSDGIVDYYLNPDNVEEKEDGTPSDVSNVDYDGNAMVEWGKNGKKIWYKIVADSDDNGYSVYIADHKEDEQYEAWSFINNQGVYVDHFYTPIYNGSLDLNNKLRSLSGQNIMHSKTGTQEITYAKANNKTDDMLWYTETFCDSMLINLLLVLMGKSLDTQGVFGQGNTTGGQSSTTDAQTGQLNKKGMFYGSTSTTQQVKVFFMENYWGHQWRRIAGLMNSNYNYYYKMTNTKADGSDIDSYGTSITGMLNGGATPNNNAYISKMKVVDGCCILPIVNSGASNTYYCDYDYNSSATTYAFRGGYSADDSGCGVFCVGLHRGVGHSNWYVGAALSCKPLAR